MPLGKYFCDYCDKQFQDTPMARKRHLEGAQHQRAKALWYASFHSPGLGLHSPGVCNNFGFCQFGDGCRYLHPTRNLQIAGQAVLGNVTHDQLRVSRDILPPSLRPPPEGGYSQIPFVEWG
ncbi:C2H2 and C2HC zinc fingers superfamily protein isoform X2 [Wolffia australiana]